MSYINLVPFYLYRRITEILYMKKLILMMCAFLCVQCTGKKVANVDDKDMLEKLSHCKEMGAAFLADAAMAVVVMADPLASDVWIEDASIASIMIQLQAEDLGLGSCWIQVRERFTATGMPSGEYVHTLLDIPLQLQVVSIIAVGHKGMERKPFNEEHLQWEKIHINKYGGK